MEQKLTLADLASGLSRRASVPMRYSEDFVRSFFKLIEEGLMHDNIVKIKGLGTFKLIGVDARESINVNTGERFEIAGHTKVNFTPDSALRDCVNKPFLEFETVILNDGTDISQMEAVDDESQFPGEEVVQTAENVEDEKNESESNSLGVVLPIEQPQENIVDEAATEEEKPIIEEAEAEAEAIDEALIEGAIDDTEPSQPNDIAETPIAETPIAEEEQLEEEHTEEQLLEEVNPNGEDIDDDEQPSRHGLTDGQSESYSCSSRRKCFLCALCYIFTIILSLILGYVIAYYWRPIKLPEMTSNYVECPVVIEEQAPEDTNKAPIVIEEETKPVDIIEVKTDSLQTKAAPSKEPSERLAYPQVENGEYWIVGVEGTEVMTPGKTLLNISIKYYKSKDYVNYICTMNDITNPDIVPLNKELRIPKLQKK